MHYVSVSHLWKSIINPFVKKDSSLLDGTSQHPFFNGVLKVIPLCKFV